MLIEELTPENLFRASRDELHKLHLRASQLIERYEKVEKNEQFVNVNWELLGEKLSLLSDEMLARKLPVSFSPEKWQKILKLREKNPGIYLVNPHGRLIWEGKKKMIVKSRKFPRMVGKPLILVSGNEAFGIIKLRKSISFNLDRFDDLFREHRITDQERADWWEGKKELYGYYFDIISRYEKPRPVIVPRGTQTFMLNVEFKKALVWGLAKPSYRIFEVEDLDNTPGFKEAGKGVVVEVKFDWLRAKITKRDGKVIIHTDPEETATPNKTGRLPHQVRELESMKQDNFALDAEVIMMNQAGDEVLHRTMINALVNAKTDPVEPSKRAHIYVFDVVELDGKSTKAFPLKERKEELNRFKDSEHIHFVRSMIGLKRSLSFITKLPIDQNVLDAVVAARPSKISEGAMIKLLDAPYSGKTWAKYKVEYEVDSLVIGKKPVKDSPGVNSFELAVGPISGEWADAIRKKDGKAAVEFKNKFYNRTGWSNNSKQKIAVGSILRISAEDVNKFETDNPEYPYYKTYVARVKQGVPEKKSPDGMAVLERLSELTPKRERIKKEEALAKLAECSVEELERIALSMASPRGGSLIDVWRPEREEGIEPTAEMLQIAAGFWKGFQEDIKTSIEAGKIPKEIYERYAREGEPLPAGFYTDYREGESWCQCHLRGCEPDDVKSYQDGKLPFWKVILGHSIHLDLRMKIEGLPKLVQYVVTESDVPSYFKMLKGEKRETAAGIMNVQHSFVVIKPSALLEPGDSLRKDESKVELIIDEAGAKLIERYQLFKRSYWIPPGTVGATADKFAFMGLIWTGKVKGGVMRRDFKEFFLESDSELPELNRELLDGRFIIKCLKRPDRTARWEIWEAVENPLPADSILHKDSGDWYPVKAKDVKKFGRDNYHYGRKDPI